MPKKTSTPEERAALERLRPTFRGRYAGLASSVLAADLVALKSQRDATPPSAVRDELAAECHFVWLRRRQVEGVADLERRIAESEPGPERARLIAQLAQLQAQL